MDFKKLISLSALLTTAVSSSFAQCLESSDKPTITYSGVPCPEQPIRVTTKQNYPEGTMFSWKESVTGYMSTESSLTFIPDAAETDYSVTCEVTLPGCTPAKSDPLTIHSGTCCTTADGTPMAMTNLFFDDFGNFVSDDTYEWTDRYGVTHTETIPEGQVHSSQSHLQDIKIPFVRAYNIEQSGAKLKVPVAGSEKNKTELYDQGVYVVSKYGGYPRGVQYDNSGTKTGGMLQFDLLYDGSQDEFFEMEFDHICPGKKISFGVDVASISEHASNIEISLERDGSVIASSSAIVNGETGWKSLRESVVIDGFSESQLKLKMRYKAENPRFEGGDIAIDNLFLSVCTAPDVVLESNLSAAELLDLCTDIPLTLNTVVSNSTLYFYGKNVGFLYQYTYSDPSATDAEKIDWKDLSEIQQDEEFSISSPAMHPAFEPLVSGMADRIYFRVVVGDKDYLAYERVVWERQNAFSPCRAVSFSSIPVVAGLNCAECKAPTERLESVSFCEGSLASEPSKTIKGFMIDWFADPDLTMAIAEPEIKDLKESETFYYVLTDMATGCAGEVTEYEVTVAKAESNPVDNSKMIVYRKSDAKAGPLKTLVQQNLSVFATALSNKEYTLMIGLVDNYTLSEEPDLRTASLAEASDVMPAPTVEDIASVEDEYRWYYTYMESPEGCVSDTVLVGVVIKGAPSPITINASYCVNSDNVQTFDKYADVSVEDPLGTLKFYKSDGTEIADPSTEKPDVTTAGEHIYYVSQVSSTDGGESEKKKLVIKVYDVAPATVSPASAKYCYYSGSEVIDGAFSTAATSNYVVGSDDANASWEFFKYEPALKQPMPGAASTMRPSTFEAGETSYYGRVKYKLSAAEVCYGAHVEYPVEVVKVPDPVVNSAITYQKSDGVNGFKKPSDQDPTAFIFDKGCTVMWYDENKSMINENDATPIYNKDLTSELETIYYVSQVNMSGCESDLVEVKIIVTMNQTSLSNVTANTVTITPNPASTKINVVADGVIEKVEILNTVGKVVKVSDSKEINIADMHNGVYFVRATIDGETSVHRLVVNK